MQTYPNSNQVLFELPTGAGKTKRALDYLISKKCKKPLIVLPRKVLESNWNVEIKKWGYDNIIKSVYIQYASFIKPQKWIAQSFDSIVFDESHHLSERCIQVLNKTFAIWSIVPVVLLSATIKYEQKQIWKSLFRHLQIVQDTLQNAVSEGALPTPTICYIDCELSDEQYAKYLTMDNKCKYLKYKMKFNPDLEKAYLFNCKKRNMWLAKQKTDIVKEIVKIYQDRRSLTFCADIKHCEEINPSSNITSKNKNSVKILEDFNNKKINHITACSMLDEGCNLTECQLGIFAYLTISNRLTIQRFGRLLRHSKPIIYIIYYKNTRDEEIKEDLEKKFNGIAISKYYTQEFIMNYLTKKKGYKSNE